MQSYWLKTFVIREMVVIKNVEFLELCLCLEYGVNVCVFVLLITEIFSWYIFDTLI